jgi:Na+/H+ antiporter NhaD/arsenite permease-like protein
MTGAVWNLVLIVVCYMIPALILRSLGGFNSAADAMSNWGRRSSLERIRKQGLTLTTYARSRISS